LRTETTIYEDQFTEIRNLIRIAKDRAYQSANIELINLYWQIGEYVSNNVATQEWGNSVVKKLSEFIQKHEPDTTGFSAQNIWRMKQFYEIYSNKPKLSALLREINWTNNLMIISKLSELISYPNC